MRVLGALSPGPSASGLPWWGLGVNDRGFSQPRSGAAWRVLSAPSWLVGGVEGASMEDLIDPSPLLPPLPTPVSTSFKLIQPSASSLCAPMAGSYILLPRSFRAPGVRRWQLEKAHRRGVSFVSCFTRELRLVRAACHPRVQLPRPSRRPRKARRSRLVTLPLLWRGFRPLAFLMHHSALPVR